MNCPACQRENPDVARFCGGCGSSLSATSPCLSCGADNPRSNQFCHQCGHALEAPRRAPPTDTGEAAQAAANAPEAEHAFGRPRVRPRLGRQPPEASEGKALLEELGA
jgi:hypothetical protein